MQPAVLGHLLSLFSPDFSSLERDVCPLGCIPSPSPPLHWVGTLFMCVCVCLLRAHTYTHTLNHTYHTHTHNTHTHHTHTHHTHTDTLMREAEIERFQIREIMATPPERLKPTRKTSQRSAVPRVRIFKRPTGWLCFSWGLMAWNTSFSLSPLSFFLSFYISPSEINKIW